MYSAGVMMKRVLYWFRNDLRLNDNPALSAAIDSANSIAFVYVHDPRLSQKTCAGIPRLGWHRRRFLRESLENLRASLTKQGYSLLEIHGYPEDILPKIIKDNRIQRLCFSRECGPEERSLENHLIFAGEQLGFEIGSEWTQFLIGPDALPFNLSDLPNKFTDFRLRIESFGLDKIIPAKASKPTQDCKPEALKLGQNSGIPLADLAHTVSAAFPEFVPDETIPNKHEQEILNRILKPNVPQEKFNILRGGEENARLHLTSYLFEKRNIAHYNSTRNGLLHASDSTLFSPWLANGCLSATEIFRQVRRYEEIYGADKNSYWVIFELLWREFFKLHLVRTGPRFFFPEGLFQKGQGEGVDLSDTEKQSRLDLLLSCSTDDAFINANMRELIQTGFMSNRGRQNVASYLIYDLQIPWTDGAWMFESFLIDYDVASNWGNWAYIAGVSFDPRGGRKFNTVKQRQDYDPDGAYVAAWIP